MRALRLLRLALPLSFAATTAAAQPARGYTAADVQFMQDMIAHHAQAIVMARLIPDRTTRDAMRLLGERITVSQRDEIATMRTWLGAHGERAPEPDTVGAM